MQGKNEYSSFVKVSLTYFIITSIVATIPDLLLWYDSESSFIADKLTLKTSSPFSLQHSYGQQPQQGHGNFRRKILVHNK